MQKEIHHKPKIHSQHRFIIGVLEPWVQSNTYETCDDYRSLHLSHIQSWHGFQISNTQLQ